MLLRSNLKWALALAVIALATGPAGAQQPGASGAATASPNGASGSVSADGQVGFQRRAQLTPQDEVVEGERMIARMESASVAIRRQLEQARAQRDVVKTLCLNDKLSQVDVAIRSARDRSAALKASAARNDVELSTHEFTILSVLRQRSEQLTAEANQCIGEESAFVGETKISTTIDPNISPEEPGYPPTDPTLVSGVPACTSCYK